MCRLGFCGVFSEKMTSVWWYGIDVSGKEYVCIMNVCIYRRAGSTGSTLCVCIYACTCIMYVCTLFGALFGAPIGALGGIDVSQVEYALLCMEWHVYASAQTLYYLPSFYEYRGICTMFHSGV